MTKLDRMKELAERPTACLINDIVNAVSDFQEDVVLMLDELQLRLMQEEGQEDEEC